MTDQGDHVVLKCSAPGCGMRYPSPIDDPRRDHCPLCEAPVTQLEHYEAPPPIPGPPAGDGSMLVAVLDSIRSALNVGTMMRSADGAALDHLYLGGLTAPADNPKVVKTALGAQDSVATTSFLDTTEAIDKLRRDGFQIWAIDFTQVSTPLQTITSRPSKLAFVVGNERAGVDPTILAGADRHVHLDMHGRKTTLNVGVAFSTVAYWLRSVATPTADA